MAPYFWSENARLTLDALGGAVEDKSIIKVHWLDMECRLSLSAHENRSGTRRDRCTDVRNDTDDRSTHSGRFLHIVFDE